MLQSANATARSEPRTCAEGMPATGAGIGSDFQSGMSEPQTEA